MPLSVKLFTYWLDVDQFLVLRILNKVVTFFRIEVLSKIFFGDFMFFLGIDIGKNSHVASLLLMIKRKLF